MKNKDHRLLAGYLMNEIGCFVPNRFEKAFIIGNIEPDKNPFTYLRGLTQEEKLRGHNYGNILPVMRKLFYSLHRKSYLGVRDYYRLGKLIHYVADAYKESDGKAASVLLGNFKGTTIFSNVRAIT